MRWHVIVIGKLVRSHGNPNIWRAYWHHQSHLDSSTTCGMNSYPYKCIVLVGIHVDPYCIHA
jgi:hypothetical protein